MIRIRVLKFIILMTIACFVKNVYCTFGDEYVHIKVHVSKEHMPLIIEPDPKIPPVSPHKVIHHYHHNARPRPRPRPHKKPSPVQPISTPVLENIILSELDRPKHHSHHNHDNDSDNDNDNLLEHEDYRNHAKDVTGHVRGPIEIEETFIIKTQHIPQSKPSVPPPPKITKVNTYKIIEEKPKPHDYVHEEHDDDFEEFTPQTEPPPPSHVETLKLIETFGPDHRHFHNHNYAELQKHEYKEAFDYEKKKMPHTQTFQIIETHEHPGDEVYRRPPPPKIHEEENNDYHQSHNVYTEPAPIVEIIESDHDQNGYHYEESQEEQQKKHYVYHQQSSKPNQYHHYYHHEGHINYIKPPTLIEPHHEKVPHYHGDNSVTAGTAAGVFDGSDGGHGFDSSYTSNKRTTQGIDTFRPSPQMHANVRPSLSHSAHATINYDDAEDGAIYKAKVKSHANREFNWPEPAGYNSAAPETYSGIDSYSVGHVQGLSSADYKYPAPYP